MNYLVTWSSGEEVEYRFFPKGINLEEFLEVDKNYIITCLEMSDA